MTGATAAIWQIEGKFGDLTEARGHLKAISPPSSSMTRQTAAPDPGQADPDRGRLGKLLSPAHRRACIDQAGAQLTVSERRACAVLRQQRSTQRKPARGRNDEAALNADIIGLAKTYGRYGYRRITALLRHTSWAVNAKRVRRVRGRAGLKVPQKQPKRGRLWLNDGSCVRLRAERPNHVWSYDFVENRTVFAYANIGINCFS
jgi:hypothetical protein